MILHIQNPFLWSRRINILNVLLISTKTDNLFVFNALFDIYANNFNNAVVYIFISVVNYIILFFNWVCLILFYNATHLKNKFNYWSFK